MPLPPDFSPTSLDPLLFVHWQVAAEADLAVSLVDEAVRQCILIGLSRQSIYGKAATGHTLLNRTTDWGTTGLLNIWPTDILTFPSR